MQCDNFKPGLDRGAIDEVAAGTRKMLFRYSGLCGTVSDAVDAVRSAIAQLRIRTCRLVWL